MKNIIETTGKNLLNLPSKIFLISASSARLHCVFSASLFFLLLLSVGVNAQRTDIAGPAGSGSFGTQTVVLPNGNFVVTDPTYDEGGVTDIGAVYLYDGATLQLISTLKGVTASDQVGSGTITVVPGGNHFVVSSTNWDIPGGAANVGAVTLCSATVGCSGTVTAANSLIGATANDNVGSITALANGNYVVRSVSWDNTSPAATTAGAVTWCNAATNSCANQTVSASNSLVGSTASDTVGNGITVLTNSNFFIRSTVWDNTGAADAGAVTFCSGATGCPTGAVSAANSLVGSTAFDNIGSTTPIILSSGNVVFPRTAWDNTGAGDAGAVTFCSGTTGCPLGAVSATNSLVGSTLNDNVGSVTALTNGNYIVRSTLWNGAAADVGAVTFCSGATGCAGAVSAANSLVGTTASDQVGSTAVAVLTNGNYVVGSANWDGAAADVGAATWCDGTTGCAPGAVSAANSLVGTTASDNVGVGLLALTNGNYVVRSPNWATANVGAVTWCNGATNSCANQTVTTANSLTGATADNLIGNGGGVALAGGNYVVSSQNWDNGAALNVGAATLCSGATNNCAGQTVSPSNSLIGGTTDNNVGSLMSAFPNGNYVVRSSAWDNGAVTNAGAITFCNAATNSCANQTVSASNSLVGSTTSDAIGNALGATLTNGNLVLRSSAWDNAAVSPVATTAGAITFCHRTAGCGVGVLSAANSLVGTRASDAVGIVRSLTGGNYVVQSTSWDNGTIQNVGAVTWCSGATGCAGAVSAANSIIGSTATDGVGTAAALSNGNYTIYAANWDRTTPAPTITNARFALYGNGATGTFGLPTDAANNDRTVIGEIANGITIAPKYDPINNQMLVQRSASNAVTVLRFITTTTTALTDGNWENPATWSNGVPNQSNHPIIPNGLTVTLNSATTVTNLTVQTGGNLIFNADLTVNGTLSLGAILTTGVNTLALGCDATVTGAGANSFVNGNLKKNFCDIGAFTFPVGTTANGNEYSPVTANATDGLFDDLPSLTVRANKGNRAGMVAAESAQRYFTLTEDGELTADLTFNYTDADVNGTEADYKLYRFTGAVSALVPSSLDAGMNEISTSGVTDFATDWAIGNVPDTNTAPTITAATGVTIPLGTVASNAIIATVSDAESGAGGVEVNVASANPSNGVTISNIVNTNGTITADISTTCAATAATFTLQASDGSLTANDTLNVNLTANTPPTLSYNNPPTISPGDSTTVNPASVSDNGTVSYFVQSQGTYTGTISVNNSGVVSISNAAPGGTHTITIRATDACGLFTDAQFTLTVNVPNLSGAKTVGAGGDYPSLTGANGLFAAINNSIVTGNITADITGDLTEDGANGLNQWTESGAGNYTVTIRPADGTMKTISGNVANAMIRLNGADRVTFDGRFNNAGRFLTFRNTNTGNPTFYLLNDASGNTVRNSIVEGANAANGVIFLFTGATTGNDDNLVTENQVRDLSTAAGVANSLIVSQGSSASISNSNNTISNNELFNFTTYGIYINQTGNGNDSWTISGNTIYQTAARTTPMNGISIAANGTNTISGNTIRNLNTNQYAAGIYLNSGTNITVSRNRIYAFPGASGSTALLQGIYNLSATPVTVVNNQIAIVPSFTNNQTIEGIRDDSASGSTFNAFYNSVLVGGTAIGSSSSWAYVKKNAAASNHILRDNIFFNNRIGGTGSHFAAGRQSASGTFSSNHNLFVGTRATTAANFMDYGTSSSGTPVSFAAWQNGTGGDANSSAGNPDSTFSTALFVNPATGDLHINPNASAATLTLVSNVGMPVSGITTDFDNETRNAPTPDIGSDEFGSTNTAPTANNDSYNVNEDATLNATSVLGNDTDTESNPLTAALQTSPANAAAFNFNSDGTFNYTPNANFSGSDSFTYKANDGDLSSNTATVTITIYAVNDDPDAMNDSATVGEDSGANAVNVLGNDSFAPDTGETLTVSSVTQGANGSVVVTGGGTGVSYTPNANFNGMDSFTYTISDGNGGFDTATVNITVTSVNDNPDAVNDSPTVAEDSGANAINVLSNDSISPDTGETLTVTAITQGANGSVAITGGGTGVRYTPNANFNGGDSFTYTISDGNGGSDTATVNVTVTSVNDNPNAMNDSATVTEDSGANTINVRSNDSIAPDTGETLTVSAVTQGTNGSVAITGGGTTISYTPNPNFNGMDSFTYTVSDGNGGSDTATVNITVTAVNDAPTMNGATVSRQQNAPGTISIIATVMDVDNTAGSLTVTTTGVPTGITVSGITNTNGTISATVSAGCNAAADNNQVGLKVTDSQGAMGTATLTVNVTKETTPPVINPIANVFLTLPANSNATSAVVNFPLPTATDNCGSVTVTTNPASGSTFPVGTTSVTVTATDAAGNTSTATFTVTVQYRFSYYYNSQFLQPSQMPYFLDARSGNDVSVSYSLSGYKGANPYSQPPISQRINCVNKSPIGAATAIRTYPGDPFYNSLYDYYTTIWRTQANYAGTCRRLTLYFRDGTTQSLDYRFN